MCGFIIWIVATVGAWWAYFNARSDSANNPGGETVWLWIAIIVTALFIVPLLIAWSARNKRPY